MSEKSFLINNEFKNLSQISKDYNIPRKTLKYRLDSGMSINEAINKSSKIRKYNIDINGKIELFTLKEISTKFNIPYSSISSKLRGVKEDEKELILKNLVKNYTNNLNFKSNNSKIITVMNKTGNLKEITDYYNISYDSFKTRIRRGQDPEVIVKDMISKNKKYIFNNFEGTKKEICDYFNMNIKEINYFLRKNYSIKEAFEKEYKKNKIYEVNNFKGNISEIAKKYNINLKTLKNRLKKGFSIDEAVNCNLENIYEYKGYKGNLKSICQYYNLDYECIRKRFKNKDYSLEEAIEIERKFIDKIYFYNGEKGYLKDLCKKFNKDYVEVYKKLKYNHTLEWSIESTNKPFIQTN